MHKSDFANAIWAIKKKAVIDQLKQEATFQSGHWSSSQDFDSYLKSQGIISPIEIYHPYKMPAGYTEKSYEDFIMWQSFLQFFTQTRITNIPKYVHDTTDGTTMSEPEKQEYINQLEQTLSDLTEEEKKEIVMYLTEEQSHASNILAQQVNIIKQLNPELQNIDVPKDKILDFLIGVTSAFHPEDIKYYLGIQDFDKEHQKQEEFRQLLGFNPGSLYMEHNRILQLTDAVRKRNNLIKQKTQGNCHDTKN